jgi:hypothetical protein
MLNMKGSAINLIGTGIPYSQALSDLSSAAKLVNDRNPKKKKEDKKGGAYHW